MGRTNAENIGTIIELDTSINLDAFILTANELVTECCGSAEYNATRLELIERYLAAHFYCQIDPRTRSESVGGIGVSFEAGSSGLGLDGTRYGQQAKLLDTKGGLAKLDSEMKSGGKKPSPTLLWLGKTQAELSSDTE